MLRIIEAGVYYSAWGFVIQKMHPDYIEFFHAYKGSYGVLFDVMTEIAQRIYGDSHNPSPLFLQDLR